MYEPGPNNSRPHQGTGHVAEVGADRFRGAVFEQQAVVVPEHRILNRGLDAHAYGATGEHQLVDPQAFRVSCNSVSKKPLKRCLYTIVSPSIGARASRISVFQVSRIRIRLAEPSGAVARSPAGYETLPNRDNDRVCDGLMVPCARCYKPFERSGRGRYCSSACRQGAYRDRQPDPPPPTKSIKPVVVYECPTCEQRFLDTRRCPDCNLYCRRIGTSAPGPHCDQPVAHADLNT